MVVSLCLYLLKCWKQDKIWSSFQCCCSKFDFPALSRARHERENEQNPFAHVKHSGPGGKKHFNNLCTPTDLRFRHALHLSLLKCVDRLLSYMMQL